MWDKIKGVVGKAAPLLGTALGGPAGGAVAGMIAQALGVEDKPEAIEAAIAADPQALLKLKEIEAERAVELRRLVLEAEARAQAEETARLAEINKTIRAELATDDRYKSYWRPTFGYAVCLAWLLQAAALVYAVVWEPREAARIIEALSALTAMWGVALAILGVTVSARSKDKQVLTGKEPTGLVEALAGALGRK